MKPKSSQLPSLSIVVLLGLVSCHKESAVVTPNPARANVEIEKKINQYEKHTNEYVRVSKKLKSGDVSLTVRYIELGGRTKQERTELQQELARMTSEQAQRLAIISAKSAAPK